MNRLQMWLLVGAKKKLCTKCCLRCPFYEACEYDLEYQKLKKKKTKEKTNDR